MITPELSQFLEHKEKESILRVISDNEKIVSSGICQLLNVENEKWKSSPPAVVLFLKNSSDKYYKISVIEPSNDEEWEPTVQFEHAFSNKEFETIQMHANLLVFEANSGDIGLNFYDSKECLKFHDSVCKRKTAKTVSEASSDNKPALDGKKEKKKKNSGGLFRGLFGIHHKEKKVIEIGSPTNFKHVDGITLSGDQEDLYLQLMSKLKTSSPEEEEVVKKIVLANEDHIRKSMMVKKDAQTPKSVKEKKEKKEKTSIFNRHSKAKIEIETPTPAPDPIPQDPLNPDWSSDAPTTTASHASYRTTPTVISTTSSTSSSFFKHSHTLAADPLKSTDWEAPRKDTYGRANDREPHNVYRFQEEAVEVEVIEEAPPELPSRSSSRHVEALSTPRPPNHRGSYRWATQPESMSPTAKKAVTTYTTSSSTVMSTKPPANSLPSTPAHSHDTARFAEIKLSNNPVRTAPPPPPSAPPAVSTAKVDVSKAPPPPPPPLPAITTSAPPAPPPPPPAVSSAPPPPPPMPAGGIGSSAEGEAKFRLTAVPEVSADRRSLLDQIQSADRSKILRKVSDTPDTRQSVVSPTTGGTMIDQIQNFLDARRAGINPSDSEGSDDDDDEEWSD